MTRTALILAAHGSRSSAAVNESFRFRAAELASRLAFYESVAAFHQGRPTFAEVIDRTNADRYVVVPVMTSEGYYCDEFLPAELAKNRRYSSVSVCLTRPVGVHPRMADLVEARALEVAAAFSIDPAAASLAVVGHGTPRNPRSREAAERLTASLRDRGQFAEVGAFYLDETPFVDAIAKSMNRRDAIVLPFLISEGAHASADIPRRIGEQTRASRAAPFALWRNDHRPHQRPRIRGAQEPLAVANAVVIDAHRPEIGNGRIVIDRPIGADPRIVDLIADLAGGALARPGDRASASEAGCRRLHSTPTGDVESPSEVGNPKSEITNSRSRIPETAVNGDPAGFEVGSSDSSPHNPHSAFRIPHSEFHIPNSAFASPRAAPLRLGARASRLARWQAEWVARRLRATGANVEIMELSTLGDRDRSRAIHHLSSDNPFAGDIEAALLDGRIDLAVHSLKDLPVAVTPGLTLAAVLPRGAVTESLVSHVNAPLRALRSGAVVGTSSLRRAAQLLAVRPDLRVAPIRGPVDDRVRQVRRRCFDAAILATAGLARLGLLHEASEELPLDRFLPAPAQGAIVIQTRTDDEATRRLCGRLEHGPTRRAVTAELEFLRPFESDDHRIAAALATARDNGIVLHARLLSPDGRQVFDAMVAGDDPHDAAAQAVARLADRIGLPAEATA